MDLAAQLGVLSLFQEKAIVFHAILVVDGIVALVVKSVVLNRRVEIRIFRRVSVSAEGMRGHTIVTVIILVLTLAQISVV